MSETKKSFIQKIDEMAEKKGNGVKTLWQIAKFSIASGLATIIQLVLANLLPLIFDNVTATVPLFLQSIFNPDILFDASTASGAEALSKYAVGGIVTWGYVLPFFISNGVANIYAYIQNRKTTFRSDAPTYCFVIYLVVLVALILFSTWLQGVIVGLLNNVSIVFIRNLARTIASLAAGFVQWIVLFPLEKFVLLKEKKD